MYFFQEYDIMRNSEKKLVDLRKKYYIYYASYYHPFNELCDVPIATFNTKKECMYFLSENRRMTHGEFEDLKGCGQNCFEKFSVPSCFPYTLTGKVRLYGEVLRGIFYDDGQSVCRTWQMYFIRKNKK